jgi:DNA-directed RNA polymerase subunit A'
MTSPLTSERYDELIDELLEHKRIIEAELLEQERRIEADIDSDDASEKYDSEQTLKNDDSPIAKTDASNEGTKTYCSISERIANKSGRIRHELGKKRTNFCARSVISSDPTQTIDDLMIPQSICNKIFKDGIPKNMDVVKPSPPHGLKTSFAPSNAILEFNTK